MLTRFCRIPKKGRSTIYRGMRVSIIPASKDLIVQKIFSPISQIYSAVLVDFQGSSLVAILALATLVMPLMIYSEDEELVHDNLLLISKLG